jgi:Holliday junction DNA helicase RuvB
VNGDPLLDPLLDPQGGGPDESLDHALRPRTFGEFVGQTALVENLRVYIEAARQRDEPLDHLLLSGLPGLGKTTLAHVVAREMGVACRVSSGPALVRPGDLAGILTNLARGDLLFIDEIHRLPPSVEEYLYSAMEDFAIDILIDQGPSARSVRVPLQQFTLVGATTREGQLSAPFRSRFGMTERLDPYPPSDLERIAQRTATRLEIGLAEEAADLIARRCRGTPRICNRFVKRLRDFAQVAETDGITLEVASTGLRRLGIDRFGFQEVDRRILQALHRAGAAVGLKSIAVIVGEEIATVEDVYEPYLMTQGWVVRTPRGRRLTAQGQEWAEQHLEPTQGDGGLFS